MRKTLALALMVSGIAAAAPDPNGYYRLTNDFLGKDFSLRAPVGDSHSLSMEKVAGVQVDECWQFTPGANGTYKLTNVNAYERALDCKNDGKDNTPWMAKAGNYTGQAWKLNSVGGGKVRLTNEFLGAGRALDNDGGGAHVPTMGTTGDYSGQFWTLTPVKLNTGYLPVLHDLLAELFPYV